MQNKKTILFLNGKYCVKVAEAICEILAKSNDNMGIIVNERELESGFKTHFVDKILPHGSKARRSIRNAYLHIKDILPEKRKEAIGYRKCNHMHRHILNVLNRYNPDLVAVTSETVLVQALSAIHKTGKNTKVAVICSSFTLDKKIVNRNVDFYFVDNFDMRNQLIENGISEDRIEITPIPLKQRALENITREDAIKKMALDFDRKTVLVNCGFGDDRFRKIINALSDAHLNANVVVACNKNVGLLNLARNKGFNAYNDSINIHVAISACDLLITNLEVPLIAEALSKKKLVFGVLPKSKKENIQLDYLSTDMIIKINQENELIKKVVDYIVDLETGAENGYEEIFKVLEEKENLPSAKIIAEKILEIVAIEQDFLVKKE